MRVPPFLFVGELPLAVAEDEEVLEVVELVDVLEADPRQLDLPPLFDQPRLFPPPYFQQIHDILLVNINVADSQEVGPIFPLLFLKFDNQVVDKSFHNSLGFLRVPAFDGVTFARSVLPRADEGTGKAPQHVVGQGLDQALKHRLLLGIGGKDQGELEVLEGLRGGERDLVGLGGETGTVVVFLGGEEGPYPHCGQDRLFL